MSIETQDIVDAAKKRPALFIAAACGLVLIAVIYLRFGTLPDLENKLQENKDQLAKYEQNIKNAAQLPRQVEQIKALNAEIKKQALNPANTALNQKIFYQLESEIGVKIIELQQISPPSNIKADNKNYYIPLGFRLSFSGDYAQMLNFIRRIEEVFTTGGISTVSISKGNDTSGQRLAAINFRVLALNPDYAP
jgi:hypothetical protein